MSTRQAEVLLHPAGGHQKEDAVLSAPPLFSIVITNYNYGRFLAAAIDSALAQTVPAEVIVVDDGSTDNSRSVMAGYGDRILPIYQENRGQPSAYNTGFMRSAGAFVLFLDSDDVLDPTVVERVLSRADANTAKVHFPLRIINREGLAMGGTVPSEALRSGELGSDLLQHGYYTSAPSTGNVYARSVLEEILPMEETKKYNADTYTVYMAPFFGRVEAITEPLGSYRLHGGNHDLASQANETTVSDALQRDVRRVALLESIAQQRGLTFNSKCLQEDVHHIKLRMASLRLAPQRHAFNGDSRLRLLLRGITATWKTGYLSSKRKLLFAGWFTALALAPRFAVPKLAALGCSPASRASSMTWLLSRSKK